MAKLTLARLAANGPIIRVFLQDSSKTDGSGLAALTSASAGLAINVMRELDATPTLYSQGASTIEAVSVIGTYLAPTATKCRFIKIDDTNLPGWYEIQFAQALFGTGDASRFISGMVFGATNLAPCPFEVQLTGTNQEDTVRAGMTSLPNAAAAAANGLLTFGTGTGQINPSSGNVPVVSNIKKNAALAAFEFLMVSATDHLTPLTGLTVTCQISQDGGAFGASTNAPTEVANGIYKITLTAAEMNANIITLYFTAATADGQYVTIITQP